MKKRDFYAISLIIICILITGICVRISPSSKGQFIEVTLEGKHFGTYPLSEDTTIQVNKNTITISNGTATMSEADCSDKICKNHAPISMVGESIVCLPNKVCVEVKEGNSPISKSDFYFDTIVSATIYDACDESILDGVFLLCSRYENIFSAKSPDSELYKLNERLLAPSGTDKDGNPMYTISDELYEAISIGIEYGKQTNGAFDITVAPLCEIWNIGSSNPHIPSKQSIDEALKHVDYQNIVLTSNNHISFKDAQTKIDLGGLAKGYMADMIADYLKGAHIQNAIVNLGGDCVTLGSKNGEAYKIGIQKPFAAPGTTATTVNSSNCSVVTSGNYERYFKENGIIYHHILDPQNGYPYDVDLNSVTIICDSCTKGDIYATYLFSMGRENATKYAQTSTDINAILIDSSNKIIYP
ncbi:MAG: FAD:protein FMN transferase [Lachnospiraceae bacterium]|nr:FAD:protein FMN transferase [Candidatus Colinaster equi]